MSRRNERGAVLVLAVLTMMAVVMVGIAYAQVAATQLSIQDSKLIRIRARAVAEGGIEVAYRSLIDNPDFRGPLAVPVGAEGLANVNVSGSRGALDITSVGQIKGFEAGYRSHATIDDSSLDITGPMMVAGNLNFNASQLSWEGEVRFGGSLNNLLSSIDGAAKQITPYSAMVFDYATLQTRAATVMPDRSILKGDHAGIIYCDGDLYISTGCNVDGMVVCTGTVIMDAGDEITLSAAADSSVVIVANAVRMLVGGTLRIEGVVFVDSSFIMDGVNLVEGTGAIISNNAISTNATRMHWVFDPRINAEPPDFITGGPMGDESIQEKWRKPYQP